MTVTWETGDALDLMRSMPDASVDAVICSPPFLALRDYNGMPGQWGSEPDPASFLANLLALALETRRVLTPHGSLAFELGDTYAGSGGAGGDYGAEGLRAGQRGFTGSARRDRSVQPRQWSGGTGWPLPKSLCLIPTLFPACLAYGANLLAPTTSVERAEWIIRLAQAGITPGSAAWLADRLPPARQFDPWRVRNVIVWARNNPPVGALGDKVRPATSYITVACTSERRWFDLDAVRGTPLHGFTSTRAGKLDQPSMNVPGQPQRRTNPVDADGIRAECNPAGAPPLDQFATAYRRRRGVAEDAVSLIGPTRRMLETAGRPFVIENVDQAGARAELRSPIRLCGSSFGLDVRRHRLFETSWAVWSVPCDHSWQLPRFAPATNRRNLRSTVEVGVWRIPLEVQREAMGIDWMSLAEMSQAIPPAYTEFVGRQMIGALAARSVA